MKKEGNAIYTQKLHKKHDLFALFKDIISFNKTEQK